MNSDQLVIALTKGRILDEVLPLFEQAGIVPAEDISKSRKLIFDTNRENVKLMVIRGSDVPTYVEFGSADMGVVGKDLLLEYGDEGFYEPLDLKIAACQMMTAGPVNAKPIEGRLKVATKFTNIAKKYFAKQGRQIDLIKLNGALELAPLMGLADAIVWFGICRDAGRSAHDIDIEFFYFDNTKRFDSMIRFQYQQRLATVKREVREGSLQAVHFSFRYSW